MSRISDGFKGSLVADALAMPVHWYYNREALRRDYGLVDRYLRPKKTHPDSILWRSQYTPLNSKGDILREQAQYWGQRGVHYHQFLTAGENTLNFKLASELYRFVATAGTYDADRWLEHYMACMLEPHWHRDTYVEEYHRGFFTNLAQGQKPRECGLEDEHIGGLASVPALLAALTKLNSECPKSIIQEHVSLTHRHTEVLEAAESLSTMLLAVSAGMPLREAIRAFASKWISADEAEAMSREPDEKVIGSRFSPACYIAEAMPAALFLAWKYHDNFAAGVQANAMVGGDSCHRAAVVGSLLAAGGAKIPENLIQALAFKFQT